MSMSLSHEDRPVKCELAKLDDTRWESEFGDKPLVIIRFNPDEYDHAKIPLDV